MKYSTVLALAAFATLAPALVHAQTPLKLVYRPELRQVVPAPQPPSEHAAVVVARSAREDIARHEAMAHAYRGTRMAQAAVHCDRLLEQARDARKVQ